MKKLMLSLVAACAALVSFGEAINPAIFTKKCNFTVSGYTGTSTLSDFPVLIRLKADAPVGFNYADCQPDGCDLRFADEAGTLLAHEIDTWNPEGESLIWVKVPALSGTATTVTAYYGAAPTAVPPATPRAVWSKYVTVIHGGTAIADSSANDLTLTPNGVSVTAAGGAVGGGMTKEKKKGINIPNPYTADLFTNKRQYSMSFWAKVETSSLSGVTYVTLGGVENWGNGGFLGLFEKNNGWSVAVSGNHHYDGTKGALPAKTWTYTAFSYDTEAGNYTSYSNGALLKAWEKTHTYTDAEATYWTFGGYSNKEADDNFYGELDEYRIYDGIASADWFKAEYDSANNAAFAVGAPVMDIEETPEPSVACVQTVQTLTALGLDITVTGFGEDATSCDLHAVLASDSGYSDVLDSFDLTAAAVELAKGYPIGAEGLHFGTPYYLKVTATNDKDQTAIVEKIVETLPEPPCKMTFDKEKTDDTFVSFFWSVSSLGELSTFAAVSVEWDTSDSFSAASSQVIVEKLESATNRTRVVVRDLTPSQTYYFRLKTVNECGIVGYSDVLSATTGSKASNTLIWANLGTDMNDPMNWVERRTPTKDDTVYFVDAPVVQPQLTDSLTIYSLQFNGLDNKACPASGYELTAVDGAVLTIVANYINQDTQYAVLGHFSGTNTISAPVYFSGNKPQVGGTEGTLLFDGPVSTKDDYSQEFNYATSKSGIVIFGHANPDFKPKRFYGGGSSRFAFTDPDALMSLTKLEVSSWAAGDDKTVHFQNLTGSTVSFPNLVSIKLGDTDNFAVDGSPVVASNCVFSSADRGTSYTGNTLLLVKSVENTGNGCIFRQNANGGAFQVLEDFGSTVSGVDPSVEVNNGMFVVNDFARAFPTSASAHNRFNGDSSRKPVLGINEDVSVRLAYNGGIFFGHTNGQDKDGGFAAIGGERHLTLLDANGDKIDPVAMSTRPLDATDDKNAWATPSSLLVGNKWASGTVVFENNFFFPANNTVYAYQGMVPVAGRFVGDLTVDSNGHFYKNGDGALAIEGTLTMGTSKEFHVREGGLLVNTDLSGLGAQVRLDGSAWIGGTGAVAHIHKESGGATDLAAIRPGEFGKGTLTVKGTKNSKFAANTGVIVDITAKGTTGLLKLEGDINTYSSGWSGYWMRIEPQEGAPAGKYKIMDWTDSTGTPNNIKLIKADSYTVQYDETKVKKAELVVEGTAMYLKFRPVTKGGMMVIIR